MTGSLNKVLLIGRLGADPDIKQMVNGKSVARLSLATSNTWKDKNTGERKEKTEWHRVVIFNEGLIKKEFYHQDHLMGYSHHLEVHFY